MKEFFKNAKHYYDLYGFLKFNLIFNSLDINPKYYAYGYRSTLDGPVKGLL